MGRRNRLRKNSATNVVVNNDSDLRKKFKTRLSNLQRSRHVAPHLREAVKNGALDEEEIQDMSNMNADVKRNKDKKRYLQNIVNMVDLMGGSKANVRDLLKEELDGIQGAQRAQFESQLHGAEKAVALRKQAKVDRQSALYPHECTSEGRRQRKSDFVPMRITLPSFATSTSTSTSTSSSTKPTPEPSLSKRMDEAVMLQVHSHAIATKKRALFTKHPIRSKTLKQFLETMNIVDRLTLQEMMNEHGFHVSTGKVNLKQKYDQYLTKERDVVVLFEYQ